MLRDVMLSIIMLSVIMLSVIMLSVIMLSVIMLSVIMLSVLAPLSASCQFQAQHSIQRAFLAPDKCYKNILCYFNF